MTTDMWDRDYTRKRKASLMYDEHNLPDVADLMAMLATDLDAAFEQVVLCFQRRIYAFALRMSGNPEDAEEVAQDTFVRAYRALAVYPARRVRELKIQPWLYQIALNVFRNRVRGGHLPVVSLDMPEVGAMAEIADTTQAQPEAATVSSEQQHDLAALVATLPQRFREAVVLRHVEGFSYQEIATLLGEPIGTVKSDVHRGTRLLRQALATQVSEVR